MNCFFSNIENKSKFKNNPTIIQVPFAYKKLLDAQSSDAANYFAHNNENILKILCNTKRQNTTKKLDLLIAAVEYVVEKLDDISNKFCITTKSFYNMLQDIFAPNT